MSPWQAPRGAAALLPLVAAVIHLWVAPEHLREWWGYGAFFLAAALAQGGYGALVLRRPRWALLAAGIAGNGAIAGVWAISRAVGVPPVGPAAGEAEPVGTLDVAAPLAELALIGALGVLAWRLSRTDHTGARPLG